MECIHVNKEKGSKEETAVHSCSPRQGRIRMISAPLSYKGEVIVNDLTVIVKMVCERDRKRERESWPMKSGE